MNEQEILRIHIENSQPIEISDFTKTMNGIGGLFSSFAQRNGKSKEEVNAKLYVSKIQKGSIDIHLIENPKHEIKNHEEYLSAAVDIIHDNTKNEKQREEFKNPKEVKDRLSKSKIIQYQPLCLK